MATTSAAFGGNSTSYPLTRPPCLLPELGSKALYASGGQTPSIASLRHTADSGVPIPPPTTTTTTTTTTTAPLQPVNQQVAASRYIAKLEECSQLYAELQKAKEELQIARQHISGAERDCTGVLTEAARLNDVVQVMTHELHTKQSRVSDLEKENQRLRVEVAAVRHDREILTASRAVMEKKKKDLEVAGARGRGSRAGAAGGEADDPFYHMFPQSPEDCGLPAACPALIKRLAMEKRAGGGAETLLEEEDTPDGEPVSFLQPSVAYRYDELGEREIEVEVEVEVEVECSSHSLPMAEGEGEGEVNPAPGAEDAPSPAVEAAPEEPKTPLETAEEVVHPDETLAVEADVESPNPESPPSPPLEGEASAEVARAPSPVDGEVAVPEAAAASPEDGGEPAPVVEGAEATEDSAAACQFPEPEEAAVPVASTPASPSAAPTPVAIPPPSPSAAAAAAADALSSPRAPIALSDTPVIPRYKTVVVKQKKKVAAPPLSHRPADVNFPVLLEYLSRSFDRNSAPHVEALRSLYRGDGSVSMVTPPIAFTQMEVWSQLLHTPTPSLLGLWAVSHLRSLRVRFEDPAVGIPLLASMLQRLLVLEELEVFHVNTTAAVERLAEVLTVNTSLRVLSLPQLAVKDEALMVLWKLLQQRAALADQYELQQKQQQQDEEDDAVALVTGGRRIKPSQDEEGSESSVVGATAPAGRRVTAGSQGTCSDTPRSPNITTGSSSVGGASSGSHSRRTLEPVQRLRIPTLDLSRCLIEDSMTMKQIFCPGVEVLLLSGLDAAITDTSLHAILRACCPALHTLDISGCTKVTTDAMAYLNRHEHVVVLRAQNCPQIKRFCLSHVELLFSSLNFAVELRMPRLKRLPIPIENASILRSFEAPLLQEVAFHGIQVHAETLQPALCRTTAELKAMEELKQEKVLRAETRRDQAKHKRRIEAEDRRKKEDAEAAAAAAAAPPEGGDQPALPEGEAAAESMEPAVAAVISASSSATSTPLEVYMDDDDDEEEGGATKKQKDWLCSVEHVVRHELLSRPAPPLLRRVIFTACHFMCADELSQLLSQQPALQSLSLHGCSGVVDEHIRHLSRELVELDVGLVGSLSDDAIRSLVTIAPGLQRLNLKAAGGSLTNGCIHSLYGLTNLHTLNLLDLSSEHITGTCVSALAATLKSLTTLYHETAIISAEAPREGISMAAAATAAAAAAAASSIPPPRSAINTSLPFLHILRTDEEAKWLHEVNLGYRELIRLRNSAALALWLETTMPKPSALWPTAQTRIQAATAEQVAPTLLYTPSPPTAWRNHRPVPPGYNPLLVHPSGLRLLTSHVAPPGADGGADGAPLEGENSSPSLLRGSGSAGGDRSDGGRGGDHAGSGPHAPVPQHSSSAAANGRAARVKAALEASFTSSSDDEEEEERRLHQPPREATIAEGGLHKPYTGGGGGTTSPGSQPQQQQQQLSPQSSHPAAPAVDQQAVDEAEMGPWGEEDELEELARKQQQQHAQ